MNKPIKGYFYCQPDGSQWNVPVDILNFDVQSGYTVIQGKTLVGTFKDADGMSYMLVNTLHVYNRKQ